MYIALTRALGEEIRAIKGLYRRERQAIERQHRRLSVEGLTAS
jgi:hypothetical protein